MSAASYVLGIDPGLENLGIAVATYDDEHGWQFQSLRVSVTKPETERGGVMADIKRRVAMHCREIKAAVMEGRERWGGAPAAFCVESAVFPSGRGAQKRTIHALARVAGMIEGLAAGMEVPVIERSPQRIKAAIAGTPDAEKEDVQRFVQLLHPELAAMWPAKLSLHEHAGDAAGVLATCLGDPELKVMVGLDVGLPRLHGSSIIERQPAAAVPKPNVRRARP
jgi:Holliday junction resolvasome RuvABC endonuclease subunit